ncbi:nucleotidyltransferase family protein [Bacillaceae bacterium IKA-2]|nr:nucleotidyltransferase family protein [Bacillaceae bacterium IKA-2]
MDNNISINVERIPKELKLLLDLIKVQNEEFTPGNREEQFRNINWDLTIKLAKFHRLYPFLYPKLKDVEFIPSFVVQELSEEYQKNTFQMLYLCAKMEHVSKLFIESEIPVIFLKGPALAKDLYGDISLRTSSDLDVLVQVNRVEEVENLLLLHGFEKKDNIRTVLGDWKWRYYHNVFFHPQKNIKLEIHWRLNPGPGKEPSFHELWDRKRQSFLISCPVYMLGREDLFLFLVSHGARHGWFRLRWLMDIHQMMKQDISWKKVSKLINSFHNPAVIGQAMILVSYLLGTHVPKEMEHIALNKRSRRLAQAAIFYFEKMVNPHTEPIPDYVSNYNKRYLFSIKSINHKFLFTLSLFYPYPEDAEALPLPTKLHFLYFPLRPLIWVWRKTRKHAIS